jgi:hypothetical protein
MRPADWTLAREPTVSVMRAVRPDRSGSMKRAAPRSVVEAIRGGGDPLAPAVRDHWESRLGQDLTRVRVHSDGHAARAADAIDASAFTVGRHIAFGTGYGVTSDNGRLLGHELAHTVQQGLAEAPNHELVVGPANGAAGERGFRWRHAVPRRAEQNPATSFADPSRLVRSVRTAGGASAWRGWWHCSDHDEAKARQDRGYGSGRRAAETRGRRRGCRGACNGVENAAG